MKNKWKNGGSFQNKFAFLIKETEGVIAAFPFLELKVDVMSGAADILWSLERNQEKYRDSGFTIVLTQGQRLLFSSLLRHPHLFKWYLVGFSCIESRFNWHGGVIEDVRVKVNFILMFNFIQLYIYVLYIVY